MGKQYTYGKESENISDIEKPQHKVKFLEKQNRSFKKVQKIGKEVLPEALITLDDIKEYNEKRIQQN